MKATALLTALLSILLAGCSLRKPPKAAAAPPAAPKPVAAPAPKPAEPLSIPQTHVALPAPQPLDPASLVTEPPPAEPVPAPAPPPRPRRAGPPAAQPVSPPAAAAPEPPREPVQEIVTPTESKQLRDRAQARRREARQILGQLGRRRLTDAQRDVALSIGNFLALSEEAEKRNDLRQADALAERAHILAKELQSGR